MWLYNYLLKTTSKSFFYLLDFGFLFCIIVKSKGKVGRLHPTTLKMSGFYAPLIKLRKL